MRTWTNTQWETFYEKLGSAMTLLHHEKEYPIKKIEEKKKITVPHKQELSPLEEPTDFMDNYQLESHFIRELFSGEKKNISKLLQTLNRANQTTLSKNPLQGKKYRLVSLITLMTRATIQKGCAPNLAYRLSDELIQKLDAIDYSSQLPHFIELMISEFSIFIRKDATFYPSEVVNQVTEFIARNLYEPITNEDIAEYVGVHPVYLSSQFKKITGIGLHQYLLEAKVNEAKYLLTQRNLSFKDISAILYFSNQSHFSKVFKQITTYTPKEFRAFF